MTKRAICCQKSSKRTFQKITSIMALALLATAANNVKASVVTSSYITGDIKDITSVRGALMVRIDDDRVPTICAPSGTPWMRIDQADAAMVSVVLSYWMQGKRRFTLYTDGWTSGYCPIQQADPEN
jgi:hypothetical protein